MRREVGMVWQRFIRQRLVARFLIGTVLAMLLAVQGVAQLANLADLTASPFLDTPLLGAQLGRLFAVVFCLVLQGCLMIAAPLLAMGTYTDDPLLAHMSPTKLLARLLAIWGLLLTAGIVSAPFFSILPLFGSLTLLEIGWALAVVLITALLSGAYSICCITLVRNLPTALVAAYGFLFLWEVITVLVATARLSPPASIIIVAFNPFTSLLATLAPAFPPTGPIAAYLDTLLQFTHGTIDPALPLYRLYVAGSGLLILLFIGIAGVAVRPQPRRWHRFDTLMSSLGVLYLIGLWLGREWWLIALS